MRVGYFQFAPLLDAYEQNIEQLTALLRSHLDADAPDLLVLPELCNSGYNLGSPQRAAANAEAVTDSRFIDALARLCGDYGLHMVSGFNEKDGEALYNAAVIVGPQGYCGRYRKLHLFCNERDLFSPGNVGLPVFEIGACRVGLLVCYDWMFPEAWRALALQGVDLICHPCNLVLPGQAQKAIPGHALTNRIYVVTANRIGTEGDLTFTGGSMIVDPQGDALATATRTGEHFTVCDIDPARARGKQVTARDHAFNDRRPAEYAPYLGSHHEEKADDDPTRVP